MVEGQIPVESYETGNTKHKWDLKRIKKAHHVVVEHLYKKGEIKRGFANRTLHRKKCRWSSAKSNWF